MDPLQLKSAIYSLFLSGLQKWWTHTSSDMGIIPVTPLPILSSISTNHPTVSFTTLYCFIGYYMSIWLLFNRARGRFWSVPNCSPFHGCLLSSCAFLPLCWTQCFSDCALNNTHCNPLVAHLVSQSRNMASCGIFVSKTLYQVNYFKIMDMHQRIKKTTTLFIKHCQLPVHSAL